ncbi:butyrophilin subfamily 1 member A1-like [Mauremys reevesii]|uniref:butyrophilin subfamily 1 member A1-like n=1 Tax=Mauremys reevesii TaxID=260615 RepID=UPI00193F053E|nr:butyrophilin subfamily 1 member A1-like [Mauremys reevesii]
MKMRFFTCLQVSIVSSSLAGYIIFFILLPAHTLESAHFQVIGPDHPIIATAGEEIVLPCHLSPRMSAENMEVRWFRYQFSSVVHLYRPGKELNVLQMSEYQGRTEFLRDSIRDGNVSLRIQYIRPSDEGQYTCFFQSSYFYGEAVLELKVAGLGSNPLMSVDGYQEGGIRVMCQSSGWYPEPEVLWRSLSGQHLPSFSESKSRGESGLFETQTSIIITENSNQNISCLIRNTHFNHEKESTIFISDPFSPRVSPWMVALCVILVVLVGFIGLTAYLFRLKGKHLENNTKLQTELDWRRSLNDAANVTLDPDTAHPLLIVSADQKSVRWAETGQDLPNNSERFDSWACVLGCEGFNSGRHYWEVEMEVEVGDGGYWAVGVAKEAVERKRWISHSPEGGIWAVGRPGGQYQALTSPTTPLSLSRTPSRIRVCLDCEQGQVTFIDAGDEALIFTFPPGSIPGEKIQPSLLVGIGSQISLSH